MSDNKTSQADADRMRRLLAGELTADEETRLLADIERNEQSRQLLEEMAASSQFRSDVREFLGNQTTADPLVARVLDSLDDALPGGCEPSLDFLEQIDQDGYLGQFDGYRIIECIGAGGMGIVLKALDPTLNRIVALKVLSPRMAASINARKRFLREARAAAAVSHDHVVTIHAVGEADGLPYLVMEFVRGSSLQEKINSEGSLELKEILRIGMQSASGLAAAHAQGLIHRDVKPGNILLENHVQRVKITDFGLARAVDDPGITHAGTITGTPEYMAPEQARGESLDARADLFGLGSILYAMCTGESPYRADSIAGTIHRVCEESPRPIRELNPDIPHWLVGIVARLHAKPRQDRYQTASEVADLLARHLAEEQQGIASPAGESEAIPKPPRNPRPFWLLCLGMIVLVGGGLAFGAYLARPSNDIDRDTEPSPAADFQQANRDSSRGDLSKSHDAMSRAKPAAAPPGDIDPLDRTVTLAPPYKPPYAEAPTDRLSVQYAVIAICEQIGLQYQWSKSQANTAPLNRRWVRLDFSNVPAREALGKILAPLGLTYEIKGRSIYLKQIYDNRAPIPDTKGVRNDTTG